MFATGGMQGLYMPVAFDRLQEQQPAADEPGETGIIGTPFPANTNAPSNNEPAGNVDAPAAAGNNAGKQNNASNANQTNSNATSANKKNNQDANEAAAAVVVVDLDKLKAALAALQVESETQPGAVGRLSVTQWQALSGADAKVRATLLASSPAGVKGLVADIDIGPDNNVDKLFDTYTLADLLLQDESLGAAEKAVLQEVKKQVLERVGATPSSANAANCEPCTVDRFRQESPVVFWGLIGALVFFFLATVITWIVQAARGSGKRAERARAGGNFGRV